MSHLDVLNIVRKYIEENDFDGLHNDAECACESPDLAPCGAIGENCTVGYKVPCDCGDHDWHISPNKEGRLK